MGAQNNFKGKFQEGTFANGQGPISGIELHAEPETKGQIEPKGPQRNLTSASGSAGDGLMERSEEPGFDIYGSSYKGPQNFKPENKGDVSNFNVNK